MSLKDDLETMRRHRDNGTLEHWFEGIAPELFEPAPTDPGARPGQDTPEWLRHRGD